MTIAEIISEGFRYAWTCRSLWLFGFIVGVASGGSNGGGRGGGGGAGGLVFSGTQLGVIFIFALLVLAVLIVMRFISEGALIEGVVRARKGGVMTTGEGFRAGWAHWGVLLRIALLFLAVFMASVAAFVAPCVIVLQAFGPIGVVLYVIPALLVAVPWLVTLFLVQSFAWRIAVLENRRALDAIGKARLFLHGRLVHGLKLMVATLLGTLVFIVVGVIAIVPIVLMLVALIPVIDVFPVILLGCLVLLPATFVLAAMLGTFRSSIWTIGYVTQVES